MDYAAKIWVGLIVVFVGIIVILLANGGLVWTDRIEQIEKAQNRVIPKDYKLK